MKRFEKKFLYSPCYEALMPASLHQAGFIGSLSKEINSGVWYEDYNFSLYANIIGLGEGLNIDLDTMILINQHVSLKKKINFLIWIKSLRTRCLQLYFGPNYFQHNKNFTQYFT